MNKATEFPDELDRLREVVSAQSDEIARLREALEWALPLAEGSLEYCRQMRIMANHTDIGKAEGHIGLWPHEIKERDNARAILKRWRLK